MQCPSPGTSQPCIGTHSHLHDGTRHRAGAITTAGAGQWCARPRDRGPIALVILGGLFTSTALNVLLLPGLALRFGKFDVPADNGL